MVAANAIFAVGRSVRLTVATSKPIVITHITKTNGDVHYGQTDAVHLKTFPRRYKRNKRIPTFADRTVQREIGRLYFEISFIRNALKVKSKVMRFAGALLGHSMAWPKAFSDLLFAINTVRFTLTSEQPPGPFYDVALSVVRDNRNNNRANGDNFD